MTSNNPIVEAEFTLLKRHAPTQGLRSTRRYRCDLATLCRVTFPGCTAPETGWVHDLSKHGISLVLGRALEVGSNLSLRLKGHEAGNVLEIQATIIHCTPEVDGNWRIGCTLARRLTDEELDQQL
jgi:hypothetical protein